MCFRDVVDKLLNKNRFTNTGTTEETNLTTLRIRCEEVNNLDPCDQHLSFC